MGSLSFLTAVCRIPKMAVQRGREEEMGTLIGGNADGILPIGSASIGQNPIAKEV